MKEDHIGHHTENVQQTLDRLLNMIQENDCFLITTHIHPDGDSLASVLVFAEILEYFQKSYCIFLDDTIPGKYNFLPGISRIKSLAEACEIKSSNAMVVLDASNLERIGDMKQQIHPGMTVINIDHHPGNHKFGDLNLIQPEVSSTAEIVYALYKKCQIQLTLDVAQLVYTGIVSDTGCFRFNNTNEDSLEISAELVRAGVVPSDIIRLLYHRNSVHTLEALGWSLTRIRFFQDQKIVSMYLTHDDLLKYPEADTEGFVNYLLMIEGPSVQLFAKETEPGCFRVSLRSSVGIDVNRVAQKFDGGGHASAAGCYIQGDIDNVYNQVLRELTPCVPKGKAA